MEKKLYFLLPFRCVVFLLVFVVGAILAGKCVANKELNSAVNISEGKVFFDFEFTPAYPAEHVTFRAYLNNENIETILLENLA